jgi:hypothetical protein
LGGDEADEADDDEDDDDEDDDDELVWVVLKFPSQQLAALVSQRLLKHSSRIPRE